MAEVALRPEQEKERELQFRQVSRRRNYPLPGCSFGIGAGSAARYDAQSVFTVWFVTCWSFAILILAALAWAIRRALLGATARHYDIRQVRAVEQFHVQYPGCKLGEAALGDLVSERIYAIVAAARNALGSPEPVRIWFVDEVEDGAQQPNAFVTYYFIKRAPIIICPWPPDRMNDFQRFILYHELGHVSGYQTSHELGRMLGIADGLILAIWFASFAPDHIWGLPVLGLYATLRVFELSLRPSSPSAEAHADLWGLAGLEADGVSGAKLDRVLALYERYLHRIDPEGAAVRFAFVQEARERQRQERAEKIAELVAKVGSGGVVPYELEENVGTGFQEILNRADNQQLAGPKGIGPWRYGSMLLTSIFGTILLGVALPPITIASARFGLCVAAMLLVYCVAQCAARKCRALSPERAPTAV